ncbi:polymorphic toxin type 37 domain-containing protein [Nocardia pneumoniae]|uniref:polymorphic toxin type 37 domain-containing protein n=1 Tax=Nocardia pneumoniae TaxID=228601 RepID=UPI0024798ACD|nr:polymorphic toxin type 37 domain-containing protein [Nocardia pneumoniae]
MAGDATFDSNYKPPANAYDPKRPKADGRVWVPTGQGSTAHGGPHWDVQEKKGGYPNVYPGGKSR